MAQLEACYQKDNSIVFREIAGEAILVPIRQKVGDMESIYTLNETGARVWALIDGQRPVREILDQLTAEFEVSAEQAQRDVFDMLGQLEAIGAVHVRKEV